MNITLKFVTMTANRKLTGTTITECTNFRQSSVCLYFYAIV